MREGDGEEFPSSLMALAGYLGSGSGGKVTQTGSGGKVTQTGSGGKVTQSGGGR